MERSPGIAGARFQFRKVPVSQYGEHEFILEHFAGRDPSTLSFMDVGAFDGRSLSNTWPLAQAGWSGLCVEPSPPAFCWLMKHYADNPRVQLLNACIVAGQHPANHLRPPRPFLVNTADCYSADYMSTLVPDHAAKFACSPFREILTPCLTWWDVVGCPAGRRFSFINIDTEGTNLEVFLAMPYALAEMVCVELDPHDAVLDAVEKAHRHTKVIGGNVLGWGIL